ncbi:hypothetical protein ACRRHL_004516 [Citrobacter farmeri]
MTIYTNKQLIDHAQKHIAHDAWLKENFPTNHKTPVTVELARIALASLVAAPVAWTDEQELQDVENSGCGYLFTVNPVTQYADPFRVIKLFAVPPAPVVLTDEQIDAVLDSPGNMAYVIADKRERMRMFAREILRAAMLQANSTNYRGLNHANDR